MRHGAFAPPTVTIITGEFSTNPQGQTSDSATASIYTVNPQGHSGDSASADGFDPGGAHTA